MCDILPFLPVGIPSALEHCFDFVLCLGFAEFPRKDVLHPIGEQLRLLLEVEQSDCPELRSESKGSRPMGLYQASQVVAKTLEELGVVFSRLLAILEPEWWLGWCQRLRDAYPSDRLEKPSRRFKQVVGSQQRFGEECLWIRQQEG